jgi:putative membrane protein
MFIDYLSLLLVDIGAGLAGLAHYLYRAPAEGHRRGWAAGFFVAGLLGILLSLPMELTWPLPSSFNIAYGDAALYLSMAFIGAAITLTFEWEPLVPALYGLFGAIYGIILGIRLWTLHMGADPALAGIGYIVTGLGGIFTVPALVYRNQRMWAYIAAVLLAIAALIWLVTGYEAGWAHLSDFIKYLPPTMTSGHH